MAIEARNITKRFGDYVALDDVTVTVPDGSLTALLGPSGSGKSTLLRVIAGLETPDSGTVLIEGDDVTRRPARTRGVGMVFQHYAAFKHMTVAKNVAFGLDVRKRPKAETKAKVTELLELVGLAHLGERYPSQLSGGQRQRMALARALAVEPRVLLLDEPFGALDARVREELRRWLRRLHDDVHVTTRPARTRGVGMVFQHYAAFKHMTVAKNVAFGLDVRKRPKAETRAKVAELLELVGLSHLGERYPSQLSGGQRQRMALARALAVEPRVLLLDEPFGALDARVREELRRWLRRLHDDVHVTTIFVTHDQEEAMEISEQIVVVNEGRIEQSATPGEIYDHPATPFVMSFVGPVTRVEGEMVRPHDVQVLNEPGEASQQAVVTRIWWLGFEVRVELLPAEGELMVAQMSRAEADTLELTEGQIVHVRVDPTRARREPASA